MKAMKLTMKNYLVSQSDGDQLLGHNPRLVAANSTAEALQRYLKDFLAYDENFRDGFRFGEEKDPHFHEEFFPEWFDTEEQAEVEDAVAYARMRQFFSRHSELGERYISHYASVGAIPLTDADFEELALWLGVERSGVEVVDLDSIEVLSL